MTGAPVMLDLKGSNRCFDWVEFGYAPHLLPFYRYQTHKMALTFDLDLLIISLPMAFGLIEMNSKIIKFEQVA